MPLRLGKLEITANIKHSRSPNQSLHKGLISPPRKPKPTIHAPGHEQRKILCFSGIDES